MKGFIILVFGCLILGYPRFCLANPQGGSGSIALTSHYERPSSENGPFKDRVIVFVHGIFGDASETWTSSGGSYWPKMLLSDKAFNNYDVYVASYHTPVLGNTFTVAEVVQDLASRLANDRVFEKHREVIFVCHSLGGIVVQEFLLTYREHAPSVRFLYLFAVPEEGSQIATLAKYFNSDPLLNALFHGDENGYLLTMENQWRASNFKIRRYCAYEKKKLGGVGIVVGRLSATRNCDEPPVPIDEDHIGIVKPDGPTHQSYIALRNAVEKDRATPRATALANTKPPANGGPKSAGASFSSSPGPELLVTNNSPVRTVAQPQSVRDEGLALSKEISDFLAERRLHEVGSIPGLSVANREAPPDDITPPYMRETRQLFVEKFESRIVNVHDRLSIRGLQDADLESIYKLIPNMAGNVDVLIAGIAESIRNLSSVSPPDGMFRNDSDVVLAEIALAEANKIDSKAEDAWSNLGPDSASARAASFFFLADFRECCLNQIEYLRAELLARLGPSAFDADEMRSFSGSFGLISIEKNRDGAAMIVREYVPHFRRLCVQLKRKAAPQASPMALEFTETPIKSPDRHFSYGTFITVQSAGDATSGYVVVQFQGRVGAMFGDFVDSKLVFENDIYDNAAVSKLLLWDPANTTFAYRIGKTPLSGHVPIHFEALASTEVRVSRVLLLGE